MGYRYKQPQFLINLAVLVSNSEPYLFVLSRTAPEGRFQPLYQSHSHTNGASSSYHWVLCCFFAHRRRFKKRPRCRWVWNHVAPFARLILLRCGRKETRERSYVTAARERAPAAGRQDPPCPPSLSPAMAEGNRSVKPSVSRLEPGLFVMV